MRVMKQQMISEVPAEGLRVEAEGRGRPRRRRREVLQGAPREFNQKDEVRVSEILRQGQGQGRQGATPRRGAAQGAADRRGPEGLPRPGGEVLRGRGLEAARRRPDVLRQGLDRVPEADRRGVRSSWPRSATSPAGQDRQGLGTSSSSRRSSPGFNRPLAEVKRQIQQRLFRDLRTKAMDTFVADLKKKSKIEHQRREPGQGRDRHRHDGAGEARRAAGDAAGRDARAGCRRRHAPRRCAAAPARPMHAGAKRCRARSARRGAQGKP